MKIYAVGDRNMVEAFELIGLAGCVPEEPGDVAPLLHELARREQAGLLLVQSHLLEKVSEEWLEFLARNCGCLVLGIPGVNEPASDPAAFRRAIQTALGAAR